MLYRRGAEDHAALNRVILLRRTLDHPVARGVSQTPPLAARLHDTVPPTFSANLFCADPAPPGRGTPGVHLQAGGAFSPLIPPVIHRFSRFLCGQRGIVYLYYSEVISTEIAT